MTDSQRPDRPAPRMFDPTTVVWCETHQAFSGRECLGPDCRIKAAAELPEIEEGGQ